MRSALLHWRVVWSGDEVCRSLAELLGDGAPPVRVGNDLWSSLVDARATMHVARQLPAVERCSVAVPHDVVLHEVTNVVAAVGGGPHSLLAAAAADRLARSLDVPAKALTGYSRPELRLSAQRALADIASVGIDLPSEAIQTEHPPQLVSDLPPGSLVVIGAPGGSWFQRQLFGAGARLRAAAPSGVIVVRRDVPRVYQTMTPPPAVGSYMRVRDVLELTVEPMILVAEHGRLVGMVRRKYLANLAPHLEIGSVAEPPVTLAADEPVSHVKLVLQEHEGGPVGVVNREGKLIGAMTAEAANAELTLPTERAS